MTPDVLVWGGWQGTSRSNLLLSSRNSWKGRTSGHSDVSELDKRARR
jgi:hypothetical protein